MNVSFSTARWAPAAVGALAVGALALAPGAAVAATPIGPNQIFIGQVNGSSGMSAAVSFDVVCPGPTDVGHASGDTVGVVKLQDPIPGFGRTGKASAIAVTLEYIKGHTGVIESVTKFTTYTTKAVPKSVTAPCSGTGTVVFAPVHGGSGATSSSVPVTFVNIGTAG